MSSEQTLKRLLYIEDDQDTRDMIVSYLNSVQVIDEVVVVDSLQDSMKQFVSSSFDLILLDLNIKDSEGIETFEKVKENADPETPILVLTSVENDDVAEVALKKGAQDYLIKDRINEAALKRVINYSILRKRHEQEMDQMRSQMVHFQKMKTLGTLVSGIAHELNNPLAVVIGYLDLLVEKVEDQKLRERLEIVQKEAGRCSDIVSQLVQFSKKQTRDKTSVNINDLISQAHVLLENAIKKSGVLFDIHLDPSMPQITLNESQITIVIVNILTNSIEALEGQKGNKTISLKTEHDKDSIRTTIENTGPQIPEDAIDRIFDPFYTTKDIGQGTGLGLSLSFGIINQHGGVVEVENLKSEGVRFTITLPQSQS